MSAARDRAPGRAGDRGPAPDAESGPAGPPPAIQSMTGFARHEAADAAVECVWELKSVNAKGLDLKLRLPPSFDALEPALRERILARFARGTIQASLQMREQAERPALGVDQPTLDAVLAVTSRLVAEGHASPPSADGLLAIKGILQVAEPELDEAERGRRRALALAGFETAVDRLAEARQQEGRSLHDFLVRRLDRIADLVDQAERDPARTTEAIRTRLADQVAALGETGQALDRDRLHAEAAFLASRADIREELDRLDAHLAATRDLLAAGGPIGRRLDFMAQEFNRESNTICAKANASSLSAIGLELKVAVDQMREQVQNLE